MEFKVAKKPNLAIDYVLRLITTLITLTLLACGGDGNGGLTYTVSASSDVNGSITPASTVVDSGSRASFTVLPDNGYMIDTVSGCNGTLEGTTYTTDVVSADCTVTASFIPNAFTISTNAGLNGAISAGGVVNYGSSIDITVTADMNYGIDTVTGCNGTLNGNIYTTGTITSNCTVSASFSLALSSVSALYNTNGSSWNNYIKNDGINIFTATDTAVDGTENGGYSVVVHAGEIRKMQVTGKTSCAGLTATDELDAFEWSCIATTNPVTMVSSRLKDGKYLSDLIDFDTGAWANNRVNVYESGVSYGQSPSEVWWVNPVIVDNDGSNGTDMTQGDIRIVTIDTTGQYIMGQNNVAIVVKPGVTVTSPASYDPYPGGVIAAKNKKYLWIEGGLDAQSSEPITKAHHGVGFDNVDFSVVRKLNAKNSAFYGISLITSADNNWISDVTVESCNYGGITLSSASSNNTIEDITVSDSTVYGIYIGGNANNNNISNVSLSNVSTGVAMSTNLGNALSRIRVDKATTGYELQSSIGVNVLSNISVFNTLYGVSLTYGATDYIVTQFTSANNVYHTQIGKISSNNIIMHNTAVNGYYSVLAMTDTNNPVSDIQNNTFMGLVASNNNAGIRLRSSLDDTIFTKNTTLANYVAMNNDYGIWLENTPDNYFTGLWSMGSNNTQDCILVQTPVTGGLNGDCTALTPSDYSLTTGGTTTSSFVGKVSVDDTVNTSDTNGSASYPVDELTFNWSDHENEFRSWSIDGSVFPNLDHRYQWVTGSGRIWDWSLKTTDSVLRNALTLPGGNDTLSHIWSDASSITFLRNATEFFSDGVGNDNGLCESNETCLFTPNIASYQGHGNLISAGSFVNGTLTGITLMRYETNGR